MVEPATSWIEIQSVSEARVYLAANQVELACLIRYLIPNKITVNTGKELLAELKTMMANDYRILCNSISIRTMQANTIMEKTHQTICNIVHTFEIRQID